MNAAGATSALCGLLAEQRDQPLPADVIATARAVALDGLACLAAGAAEPVSALARGQAAATGGVPEATTVGAARRTDLGSAAFVNGVTMHALDFEAVGTPACHGTSSVLPALLAIAERDGHSGAEVLAAFVLGWEVECRLRTAGQLRPAFHPTAIHGPLAAAAACSVLLGLDAATIEQAIGIAASSCGGLAANGSTGVKAFHAGNAARVGVQSALLASQGLHAAEGILERRYGVGDAFFETVDWSGLTDAWGTFYLRPDTVNYKPYPVQFPMINVIDTVLDARPQGLVAADVAQLVLTVPAKVASRSAPDPRTGHAGKFSPEYCAAAALVRGEVGIEAFDDEAVRESDVRAIIGRTSVIEAAPDVRGVSVRVVGLDGEVLGEASREHQRGSRWAPLSAAERFAKVRGCLRAGGVEQLADPLTEVMDRFSTVDDVARLVALMDEMTSRA